MTLDDATLEEALALNNAHATELFAAARAAGHTLVTCEVNLEPPNPASARLHQALGFAEVGRARLAAAPKTVCYLACTL